MLQIKDLHVAIEGKEILRGINLEIGAGEIHAIMGPNGSGKSTLSQVLAGHEAYTVTSGSVTYQGQDLLELSAENRALEGIFLAFQYPVEIPGVSNTQFLRAAVNARRRHRGESELDAFDFKTLAAEKMELFELKSDLMDRSLNVGFSGGEKKRNEGFQMVMLQPTLAILDETDSGLDIDALKIVAKGINSHRGPERSALVITHYQRLLDYIVPDRVHVLSAGQIVESGGKELALELESKGYATWTGNGVASGTEGGSA